MALLHCLQAVRRGRPPPDGLPLELKERFLAAGCGGGGSAAEALSRPMHRVREPAVAPVAGGASDRVPTDTPSKWDGLPIDELRRVDADLARRRAEHERALATAAGERAQLEAALAAMEAALSQLHRDLGPLTGGDAAATTERLATLRRERDALRALLS